ncbi:hypothetical protein Hanom_Chr08g00697481 [Helianthus anomalus]
MKDKATLEAFYVNLLLFLDSFIKKHTIIYFICGIIPTPLALVFSPLQNYKCRTHLNVKIGHPFLIYRHFSVLS